MIEVSTLHDPGALADAIAARLISRVAEIESLGRRVHVSLTGGTIGTAVVGAIGRSAATDAFADVQVWWSDERYLPVGDPDRNDTQAFEAWPELRNVPLLHTMPGVGDYETVEAAADAYATELESASTPGSGGPYPSFDICLLGIGPDAHIASLFPEHPALHDAHFVIAVHGATKPPPTRISVSIEVIRAAHEVWIVAAGTSKAPAVRLALSDAGLLQVPAAHARGRSRTLFLLDEQAAAEIPPGLSRIASP